METARPDIGPRHNFGIGLWRQGPGARGPQDETCATDEKSGREDSPLPAVERIGAVVAEDEKASGRNNLRGNAAGSHRRKYVGFRDRMSADKETAGVRFNEISGYRDDAFDEQVVAAARRRSKDDDIAPLGSCTMIRSDDDVIARQQRRRH